MKKLSFFLIVFMVNNLSAQDLSQYKKEKIVFETDTLNYRILKPLNYNPTNNILSIYFYMVLVKEEMTMNLNWYMEQNYF